VNVSVIVPVYNQAHLTANFIKQFNRCIGGDAELIIMSDGSQDGTEELLKASGVKHIHRAENKGFSITCNQGAEIANGEILIFMNNDIIFHESFIPQVLECVEEHNGRCLFGAQMIDMNGGWNRFGKILIPYLVGWFLGSTKSLFHELGKFDEIYSPFDYEDIDLCMSALRLGIPLVQLPVRMQHLGGQSFAHIGGAREIITRRNREIFAHKWDLQGNST
jgi:GT2 family glycosyltransferase